MRRIVAIASIAVGLGLLALPFVTSLFDRTSGAEKTFDAMRETVSEPGIAVARRNFGVVEAAGTELQTTVLPGLANRLSLSDEELNALIAENFPAIARGAESIPGYLAFVGPTIDALDEGRDEFEGGDSLPGAGLPITSSPWLILLLGAGFVGTGVYALRSRGRHPLVPVAVLAAAAVVVPFALGIPGKAQDARDIGDVARGGLSQQGADTAEEIVIVLDEMVEEVRGGLVPELARRTGVTPSDIDAKFARDYPATRRLLDRWDAIAAGPTGFELAAKQQAVVDDFADADETPVLELPWLIIVPGAVLLLLAGAAIALLTIDRRPERTPRSGAAPEPGR